VYGQIAAANSLSDVYAMGGRPLTALAIAGFPKKGLDRGVIGQIFRGGLSKLTEAGVALLGGHTVQDQEVKFGYAVTGVVDPSRILANSGARPGDRLILTKLVGTGIIATAIKFGRATETTTAQAIASMTTLNRAAAEALATMTDGAVHACTDITGFGLLGHTVEMAVGSAVTIELQARLVPFFDGVLALVGRNSTGGGGANADHFGPEIEVDAGIAADLLALLYDPQTSGGLLVSVAEEAADRARQALQARGVPAVEVGMVRERGAKALHLTA
jgi:selenide,water dikinase